MSTPPMNRCIFAKLIPTRKPPGRLLLIIKYMSSFINNLRNQYSRVWRKSLQSVLCPTTKPKPQVNSQKQLSTKSNNSDRQCNNTDTSTYPTVRKLFQETRLVCQKIWKDYPSTESFSTRKLGEVRFFGWLAWTYFCVGISK